jgi:phage gp36-like protein
MPYLDLSDLTGEIPAQDLIRGLDDNNDKAIDAAVWAKVQADSCEDVDALLEGRFAVPITLSPLPKVLKRAAIAFACERIYRRRGVKDDENPWKGRADAFRKMLAHIQAGELKLSASPNSDAAAPDPVAAIITETSPLGTGGSRLG